MAKKKDMNMPTDKEVHGLLVDYLNLFNEHKKLAKDAKRAQFNADRVKKNLAKLSAEVRRKLRIGGWKGPFVFPGDKNYVVMEVTTKMIHVTGAVSGERLKH